MNRQPLRTIRWLEKLPIHEHIKLFRLNSRELEELQGQSIAMKSYYKA